MRKIHFNEQTISTIREMVEDGRTMSEICNRLTIKYDTLKRVMRENGIELSICRAPSESIQLPEEVVSLICSMFLNTDAPLATICSEAKVEYWQMQQVLKANFSEKQYNDRKSRLYRKSKLGDRNPMTGKVGQEHPRYVGVVEDGNGYLMVNRPDWYTGRRGKQYVFQHTIVLCQLLGITELPAGFVVHHIDLDKKNNDSNNLALMTDGAHKRLHAKLKRIMQGAETIDKSRETETLDNSRRKEAVEDIVHND